MRGKELLDLAKSSQVLCDGAMGTMLQEYGLQAGACPELWNMERPDAVRAVHAAYKEAGAQIITTNTFGGSRLKLDSFGLGDRVHELNSAGVAIAREAAGVDCFVAASIGPTGKFLEPLGDLTFDEAADVFAEQAFAQAGAGADIILLETFSDVGEARAALSGALRTGLPVLATMAFDVGGRTMMGVAPAEGAVALMDAGASGFGANCGAGPAEMLEIVRQIREAIDGIVIAQPNAGLPKLVEGRTIYDLSPQEMQEYAVRFAELGINIIGGCCGTTPEHIRAMAQSVDPDMKTPLYEQHLRLGAKMTDFAGWEMPLYYSGIVQEVEAVRSAAGIFDLSHMGELFVSGHGALEELQSLTTNDVSLLDIGKAQYTLMCDESGGIIDDLVIYRLDADTYMLVVNAANTESDFKWICDHVQEARIEDRSLKTSLLAVQGPASSDLLQPVVSLDLSALGRFRVESGRVGDVDCLIARTGYTGEDGFEIYCSLADSPGLWDMVLEAGKTFGAVPAGLGARDVLRLEAGYPLYGHELTRTRTPVEANLLWVVKLGKPDFLGKQAILRMVDEGTEQLLVGLEAMERCIPRSGYDVTADGKHIGVVTSGTFSPTLRRGIAMAYVDAPHAKTVAEVAIDIRGRACRFRIVPTPFYKSKQASIPKTAEEVRSAS